MHCCFARIYKQRLLNIHFKILIPVITFFLFYQCAQIVPLNGGEKDTTPPDLKSATPENHSLNFSSSSIKLVFNEKIQLLNPNENILIIPKTTTPIQWKVNNKTLEIILPENLNKNTTYKIIFNKCIADLTERNTIDYLEYIFSTGASIDSFYIKGNVKNAWTLEPENNILIALYDSTTYDSILLKEKPLYFSRTKKDGNYEIKNLPNKLFKIAAFSDNNNNMIYDPLKEKIDLKDTLIQASKDSVLHFLIAEEKPTKNFRKKYFFINNNQIAIIYSFPDQYKIIHSNNNVLILNDSLHHSDTCRVLFALTDSLQLVLQTSTHTDSIFIPVATTAPKIATLKLKTLPDNIQSIFSPIILQSDFWMDTSYFKNKILLYKSHDTLNPLNIQSFVKVNPHQIIINYPLEANTNYILKTPIPMHNNKDSVLYQKINFKTNAPDNFAQLNLNILFPEKKHYLIALCNHQHKIIYSQNIDLPLSASNLQTIAFKNILPDTYILKIIQDDNDNHQWDTHQNVLNRKKKQKAEKIFIYTKSIKLINNWDVVIDWKDVK